MAADDQPVFRGRKSGVAGTNTSPLRTADSCGIASTPINEQKEIETTIGEVGAHVSSKISQGVDTVEKHSNSEHGQETDQEILPKKRTKVGEGLPFASAQQTTIVDEDVTFVVLRRKVQTNPTQYPFILVSSIDGFQNVQEELKDRRPLRLLEPDCQSAEDASLDYVSWAMSNKIPSADDLKGDILTPVQTLTKSGLMSHETILKVLLTLLHKEGMAAVDYVTNITSRCSEEWKGRIVRLKNKKRKSHLDLIQDQITNSTKK
jgi:hypothetical protein